MEQMGHVVALVMTMLLLLSGSSMADHYPGCSAVQEYMLVCSDFLSGNSPHIPASCCNHVQTLNNLVHMCLSPQSICYCIEDLVSKLSSPFLNSRVNALPKKCNLHLSFPISNRMDCSRVHKRSRGC